MQQEQDKLLQHIVPLLDAVHAGGEMLDAIAGIPDPQVQDLLARGTKRALEGVSKAIHLVAYDVTALQHKRRNLGFNAYSGLSGAQLDDEAEATDWSLATAAMAHGAPQAAHELPLGRRRAGQGASRRLGPSWWYLSWLLPATKSRPAH